MRIITLLVMLCFVCPGMAQERQASQAGLQSITVLSDHSLIMPLNILARDYALQESMSVTTNFGSTHRQIRDITAGEEANILISAKESWIKELQQKGLIDIYSRASIARNRMVLSSAPAAQLQRAMDDNSNPQDFTPNVDDFQLILADAQYYAEGSYALDVLRHYSLLGVMEPHYAFFRSRVGMRSTQRDADNYGLLFYSDALLFPALEVKQLFDASTHAPIIYQAVVVAGEEMDEARKFVTYLQSDHAKEVFTRYGFGTVY